MAVDYDAPRQTPADESDEALEVLTTTRRGTAKADTTDVDDTVEGFASPDLDFVDEELSVPVVHMRADEFRCDRCFLVHHRSRLATGHAVQICRDCA